MELDDFIKKFNLKQKVYKKFKSNFTETIYNLTEKYLKCNLFFIKFKLTESRFFYYNSENKLEVYFDIMGYCETYIDGNLIGYYNKRTELNIISNDMKKYMRNDNINKILNKK